MITSNGPVRFFSKVRVCLAILVAVLTLAEWSFAQVTAASSCLPDEGVFFSCRLKGNSRIVSLCTAPKSAPFTTITYRYGSETKNELTYVASAENHNRFLGTVSPASPKANVRQVWFELKGTKYVATSCVGGDCPYRGGLIVLQGSKVLMSRACVTDSNSHPWFSSDVVRFGSGLESSHSNTDLIELEDYDNRIDVLYPSKQVN